MNKFFQPKLSSGPFLKIILGILTVFCISDFSGWTKIKSISQQSFSLPEIKDTTDVNNPVFITADEMPKFMGRDARNFSNWLERNLIYPVEAISDSIQGKVYVQFVIDTEGQTRDINIVKGVHPIIDDEALRLVASANGWEPGKIKKRPVNVLMTFAVVFELTPQNRANVLDLSQNNPEDPVYVLAEVMPVFIGNNNDFREYIALNIRYPRKAAEFGIQGVVYIQFIVNSEGDVTNAVVARSADPILDEEALRVIRTAPKWEPGKINGKNVSVKLTFPVSFRVSYGRPPEPPRNRRNRNN